jgi:hypothetical protein
MDYIQELKEIANKLDRQGYIKQANLVDSCLYKIAQDVPAQAPADVPVEQQPSALPTTPAVAPKAPQDMRKTTEQLARATFLMITELRDFYARNLSDFYYFGEDNIKTLQAAIDQLTSMYKVLLRNTSTDYDKGSVQSYEAHLKGLQKEIDRSKKMKITPTKVKIDKFLLYDEFEILLNKIERHYDAGLKELQPVLKKARAVKDAFANIIQQTSEQIAHADLIETK